MKKFGYFIKSLFPVVMVFILQIVAAIPTMLFFLFRSSGRAKPNLSEALASLTGLTSDLEYLQTLNIVYAILALLVFGTWYYKVFVKPFRHRTRKQPGGYSFHTIVSMIFLGIGLQYVTTMLTDGISILRPDLIASYNAGMSAQGYDDLSLLLIAYSVILAPVIEETVFRGLVFRYARHAMPFWFANILQAALFGFVHLNLVQGIYAFAMGLFLGWVCHRGRGIKYSIPVHIVFNIIGCFFSGLIQISLTLSYPLFAGLGVLLTVFALWLFYTDFRTAD
ncbi:CPBP family intramembrane glutamic endopeptidase [uncultured Eubacterium sp.]|uniref:CPBP family intramembrane glutamic endopeptidase n=1 Tax=uncultured Eubacterium sp. TaxID=165185 RepID=UPI0025F522B8|nr:type II CAAX endopeptidase family protein [uncultured Eubacterium sp.]MCI6538248.1 CPBP family intramembrane metalloprotease [Lachnospiraceae bacterium]